MGIDRTIRIRIIRAMDKPIYDCVLEMLSARKGDWKQIAQGSGVPYSTLCKVAQGHIESPSVHMIQRLHDHLIALPPAKKEAAA